MDLVLVTGAGASHNLGGPVDPLPLMPEWSDVLCSALDDADGELARRCRLIPGMDSEEFEEALGEVLRWESMKHLNERFAQMTDDPNGFTGQNQVADQRLVIVRRVINETLYSQFGQQRVDDERATAAYSGLFNRLGGVEKLVLATTNYDRSCEAALSNLERHPDTGFQSADSESLPSMDVTNLVVKCWEEGRTACLHLHGAVGWYQEDGVVVDYKGSQPFNETLGSPVLLYPDPQKDPTSDAHVAALWAEFRTALSLAPRVLVVGHSLHDPALIAELRSTKLERLSVAFYANNDATSEVEQKEWIEKQLPGAIPIGMDFGPELKSQSDGIDRLQA